jgi:hypothetical protein
VSAPSSSSSFTGGRATARAWRWGSAPTLFSVRCPLCGWTDRVAFSVLARHAQQCRDRRFCMLLKMEDARAQHQARAAANRRVRRR